MTPKVLKQQQDENREAQLPSLGDWLRGAEYKASRGAEFRYASYTHGAIQCTLFEHRDGKPSLMSQAAGDTEGSAFYKAIQFMEAKRNEG